MPHQPLRCPQPPQINTKWGRYGHLNGEKSSGTQSHPGEMSPSAGCLRRGIAPAPRHHRRDQPWSDSRMRSAANASRFDQSPWYGSPFTVMYGVPCRPSSPSASCVLRST